MQTKNDCLLKAHSLNPVSCQLCSRSLAKTMSCLLQSYTLSSLRFAYFIKQVLLKKKSVKVACMCFSAINGSGPAYLSELLHVYTPSRTLRSSSDTGMLEIQQYKRKTHGFRTFSCFGPHIWNSLPQDLRHCSTLSFFSSQTENLPLLTVFPS